MKKRLAPTPKEIALGQRIGDARLARKLSRAQLARQCDVSERTVYNWEKAINRPDDKMWLRLGGVLNIDALLLKNGSERFSDALAPPQAEEAVKSAPKLISGRDRAPDASIAERPFRPGWLADPDEVERAYLIGLRKTRFER
jgi:transcriptional regulator with XRE-family HTH domain